MNSALFNSWLAKPSSRQAIDIELARQSLYEFMRQAWPIVEPGVPFVDGWHLQAIAQHLEAVSAGHIRNLIINIPPRHAKSLLVAVFWPCWEWTQYPARRWLFASYANSLSIRDSLKCRRIIESPWYQARYGHVFRLTDDQNAKIKFENDHTGYRLATSVGGAVTGEGGDRVVVDDPHNMLEVESDIEREKVLTWWDEAMSTRLNDPKTGARVIVMQRLHERDLTGHALEQGGYEHLCLPAEYEPTTRVTSLGFTDPRSEDGALLWPERVGPDEIESFKRTLGVYGYAGQMQQRPAPRGGGMFKRQWLPIVGAAPAHARRVRAWDLAGSLTGDYTVGAKVSRAPDGVFYIEDVVRGKWTPGQRDPIIKQTATLDGQSTRVYIEQEPGSAGLSVVVGLVKYLAGFVAEGDRPTGDKVVRAETLARQAEVGNVRLVAGAWNFDYVNEMCAFPAAAHDDQVDATSSAFNKLVAMAQAGAPVAGGTRPNLAAPQPHSMQRGPQVPGRIR